jgi:hypothetical protein
MLFFSPKKIERFPPIYHLCFERHYLSLLLFELVNFSLFRIAAVSVSGAAVSGGGLVVVLGADVRVEVLVFAVLAATPESRGKTLGGVLLRGVRSYFLLRLQIQLKLRLSFFNE